MLKSKKYKKKSASKSPVVPITDTDTINKEYWESAICTKKSVIGGDGWCIGKEAWQRVLNFKAGLQPTLDYEMFQEDCCKYLQVSRRVYSIDSKFRCINNFCEIFVVTLGRTSIFAHLCACFKL